MIHLRLFILYQLFFGILSAELEGSIDVEVDRCTTIVVGAQAGVTGPMNTHTADCRFSIHTIHITNYIFKFHN